MALVLKDRVKETTTTTGTGTLTLAGAVAGFQSFSVIGNGNTTYYSVVSQDSGVGEWEVGIGTYTASGTTLARTTVLQSSNGGSAVNFSAGTKDVFVTYPSDKAATTETVATLSATMATSVSNSNTNITTNTNAITSITSLNTQDVTLAGTPDYITISNQVITRNKVDLANDVSGDLPVSEGGTGASTLTANGVLYGNGTSAIGATAVGTSGQILTSNGAGSAPTFQTASSGGATDIDGLSDAITNSSGKTVGLGTGALANDDGTTNDNTALGYNAGNDITTGNQNFFGGYQAGELITTGLHNVAIGWDAMSTGTTTGYSVAVGHRAMESAGSTSQSVAIGTNAGRAIHSTGEDLGNNSIFIGSNAGLYAPSGQTNMAVGHEAMYGVNGSPITGEDNVALGPYSLYTAKGTAHGNVGAGYSTLKVVEGNFNTGLGWNAGATLTTGANNTLLGNGAAPSSVTISNEITLGNTSITKFRVPGLNFIIKDSTATEDYVLTVDSSGEAGWEAAAGGATNINGLSDALTNSSGATIGLGSSALSSDDGSSNNNTAVGYLAFQSNTSGEYNTGLGWNVGAGVTTGTYNTFVGAGAGSIGTLTGSYNTALGANSLRIIQGSASDNIAVGYWSAYSLTTGSRNIAIGRESLYTTTTSTNNVAIGRQTGYSLTTGSNNIMIGDFAGYTHSTSEDSIFIGRRAGYGAYFGGTANIGIGDSTLESQSDGYGNVCMGREAGKAITTGYANTFIGNLVNNGTTTTGYNNTAIGASSASSSATAANEITLGNSSIATLRCQVQTISSLSDRRDKKDIEELPLGVDFINTLKPVKFTWNMRDGGKVGEQEAGFIAQDLDEAQIDADAEDYLNLVLKNNPEKLEASYGKLVPVLVKAVQELSAEVAALRKEINNG